MKKDFDHIAKNYDTDFTNSEIGKLQRNSVYKFLQSAIDSDFHRKDKHKNKSINILELNCGTGEDAIWFAKKGHTVLATDVSDEMIAIAKQKGKGMDNLKFKQLDINNLDVILNEVEKSKITNNNKEMLHSIQNDKSSNHVILSEVEKYQKFNILFSNFGGLNCLNKKELKTFFESASKLLTKRGKLIVVIMPKNTFWERLYFSLKLDFKKAFRRNTKAVLEVNVANINVKTWYYNPKEIQALAKPNFNIITTKPNGFFIPPSYLENYFVRRKRLLRILDNLENKIGNFRFLSRFSDHYLIELEVKVKT